MKDLDIVPHEQCKITTAVRHTKRKTRRILPKGDLSARQVALTIVDRITQSETEMATDWLDQYFSRYSIPWRDRGLITELVYGTLRRVITLDWVLSRYTFHRVKDHLLKNILRLGIYQIYYLGKVPAYAVVHEMVQIAKDRMGEAKARFVNAVLRRASSRDICLTEEGIGKATSAECLRVLSLAHAMPLWLLQRWEKFYDLAQIRQICLASNGTPAVFARVNSLKTDTVKLQEVLEKEGVRADPIGERLLKIRPPKSIESLESFRRGLFYVQDPTTMRIVDFMGACPTDRILDICAAPGGKAFYLEQIVGDGSRIVAAEKNSSRFQMAIENAKRLSSKVHWVSADALRYETVGKFDKILADVPCSNQGVLARRVEARGRLTHEKIERLRKIQKNILEEALRWAKPSCEIYYSTCSIDPAENEELVEEFLKGHRGWVCASKLTILPLAGSHDGGFVAKIVKAGKDG